MLLRDVVILIFLPGDINDAINDLKYLFHDLYAMGLVDLGEGD